MLFNSMSLCLLGAFASVVSGAPTPLEPASVAAAASFSRSCDTCILSETKYLHCYCRSAGGRRVETEIDLDWCITNYRGNLRDQANGGFSATCKWERLDTNFVFTANCNDPSGGEHASEIQLDRFIHNIDGILTCHGIKGVEGQVPGGPNCPYPHTIC